MTAFQLFYTAVKLCELFLPDEHIDVFGRNVTALARYLVDDLFLLQFVIGLCDRIGIDAQLRCQRTYAWQLFIFMQDAGSDIFQDLAFQLFKDRNAALRLA